MMSYPVLTVNAGVDERTYTHLRKEARAHRLSEIETQQCILSFSRRMLHALGQRKIAGDPMTGREFTQWLKESAQNHPQIFVYKYHAVSVGKTNFQDSTEKQVTFRVTSKQSEIGVSCSDEVMLSGFDGVLASAACQLSPSSRILVMWHYFGGMSVKEIATNVGASQPKITARILLAVEELQSVLSRHGYALALPRCDNPAHRNSAAD